MILFLEGNCCRQHKHFDGRKKAKAQFSLLPLLDLFDATSVFAPNGVLERSDIPGGLEGVGWGGETERRFYLTLRTLPQLASYS